MRYVKEEEGDKVSSGQKQSWQSREWNAIQLDESGTSGGVSPKEVSRSVVSCGNGTCIAANTVSNSRFLRPSRSTRHTRLVCPSATTMSTPDDKNISPKTRRGKAGQTSSMSLAGVRGVQTSCRFRRRADAKTTFLHRRHT